MQPRRARKAARRVPRARQQRAEWRPEEPTWDGLAPRADFAGYAGDAEEPEGYDTSDEEGPDNMDDGAEAESPELRDYLRWRTPVYEAIPFLQRQQGTVLQVLVQVEGKTFPAVLDTGAALTLMSAEFAREHLGSMNRRARPPLPIQSVAGKLTQTDEAVSLPLQFSAAGQVFQQEARLLEGLPVPLLIGCEFFDRYQPALDFGTRELRFPDLDGPVPVLYVAEPPSLTLPRPKAVPLYLQEDLFLPGGHAVGGV